jgi:exopolyphosphatase/guanosine-5'-triphosphate,3'-diphosphate pyrophosphatase
VAVGVIDVGSNSVRLLVAAVRDGTLIPLCEERVRLALGDDIERFGRISREKLRKTTRAARAYTLLAREHGVRRLDVVVTAPGRQSANARELLRELTLATAAPVRVLSADEEGKLAYEGAMSGLAELPRTLAVCDVGGGSTEAVVGVPGSGPVWLRSFDIGAVRLTRRYLTADPPQPRAIAQARAAIESILAGTVPPLCERALATGGTPRALRKVSGERLGRDELGGALETLASAPAQVIAAEFGIDKRRARLLPAGTLILAEMQRRLVVPLEVADAGLREGAALAMLAESRAA